MGNLSQHRAPILEGIQKFHTDHRIPFAVPGHKQGRGADREMKQVLGSAFRADMQINEGADDRKASNGYKGDAEEIAAKAFGADKCYFSSNGSSLSAHAAMMTVAQAGDKVFVPRNCHRSMIAALILAEVDPVIVEPEYDADWDLCHAPDPKRVKQLLQEHPESKALFLVSPDYFGISGNLKALVQAAHRADLPVVVDEAWGPHFAFHPKLPRSAMECGADISMGSLHKTMTSLTQASIVLMKGKRVDPAYFRQTCDLFETTSASSMILGSIDGARRQMALQGKKLWSRALELSILARERLARIDGIRVMGPEVLGTGGAYEMDLTKIVLDVRGLGISGFAAADWLWKEKKLMLELADHRRLLAFVSVADTERNIGQLVRSIQAMARWASKRLRKTYIELPGEDTLKTKVLVTPSKAYFGKRRAVPLDEAVGKVAADFVSPYPPGIPRIWPGALITREIVEYIRLGLKAGMYQEDAADEKLKTVVVVD